MVLDADHYRSARDDWFTFVGETSRMEPFAGSATGPPRRVSELPSGTRFNSPSTARGFDGTENPVAAN